MGESDFLMLPFFDDSLQSCIKRDFIIKQYIKGDPFMNKPFSTKIVSYVDAESSHSGTYDDDDGKVVSFVCDRCKKRFKADKARSIKLYMNEAVINDSHALLGYTYERAYCGRCFKKTRELTRKIFEAICAFDEEEKVKDFQFPETQEATT